MIEKEGINSWQLLLNNLLYIYTCRITFLRTLKHEQSSRRAIRLTSRKQITSA